MMYTIENVTDGDLRFLVIICSKLTENQKVNFGKQYLVRSSMLQNLMEFWSLNHQSYELFRRSEYYNKVQAMFKKAELFNSGVDYEEAPCESEIVELKESENPQK